MFMNLTIWLIIGLAAGLLVGVVIPGQRKYFTGTVFAGVVGAFTGGIVYSALKLGGIAKSIDVTSLATAGIGALVLLVLIALLISSEKNPIENF